MSEPDCPQKSPYVEVVQPGTYAWCSCGKSTKGAYCDGSHRGTDFRPVVETITEEKRVAWCGCRASGKGAFCDGSHNKL